MWADLDEPGGLDAARILAGRLVGLGGLPSIERVGAGADTGVAGAGFAPLDAAAVVAYAADLERDGPAVVGSAPLGVGDLRPHRGLKKEPPWATAATARTRGGGQES